MSQEREITRDIQARNEGEFVEAYTLVAETKKAIGLPTIENNDPVWLPKSQIDAREGEDGRVFAYVPTWLMRRENTELIQKHGPADPPQTSRYTP